MFARRVLLSTSFALCAALGVAAQPLSSQDCQSGPASGTWELPSSSGASDGFVAGVLYLAPAGTVRFYYVVKGTYSGSALTGKGTLSCDIRPPSSTQNVGKIDGTFDDAPGSSTPGTFKGDWKICQ